MISSDIGGTTPYDNQSLIHLLMYGEMFRLEGYVRNPKDSTRESWGGSFEKISYNPRIILDHATTDKDKVAGYSISEFRFTIPNTKAVKDSVYFWMEVPYGNTVQKWPGYYTGNGVFSLRYISKKAQHSVTLLRLILKNPTAKKVRYWWITSSREKEALLTTGWATTGTLTNGTPVFTLGNYRAAKTVSKWRNAILMD
ncbi:MAG TPA: hypothetical protein VL943_13110 [Niabella sp.]|nr:hypothetical protein [Niabella sp.]